MAVTGAQQRVLLAALLLHANTPVSADALADLVWDGKPASGPGPTLRSAVRRLRDAIGPGPAARIVARAPGYLIRLEASELDVAQFEAACRQAAVAARTGAWAGASSAATRALGLWRDTPLLDVPCEVLHERYLPRLEQLRVQALEDRAEAELHLGGYDRLIPELRDLTAQYPVHERFHAQLMLALAADGRRTEALETYRHARRVLVEQLGVEPGPELSGLHAQILAGEQVTSAVEPRADPALALASAPAAVDVVPRQLPAAPRHFTGRHTELELLVGLPGRSGPAAGAGGTVVISAIDGMAGIGKTALAVYAAHRMAEQYPDGQLYANLRGFDPSGSPVPPEVVIRRFLDALAMPSARIPADPDAQVGLYRSVLADKRMLIVLDNARDSAQVRPLLPGAAGCLVLITSRSQLRGLVAVDGALPLTLDALAAHEALELLIRRVGRERVTREPDAADELVRLCARLPLAVNIAATRAALRPGQSLSALVNELREASTRLNALTVDDGAADLRAVFSWSYRILGAESARVFRLLGLHPGPDISLHAAAALAALDDGHARRALDELTAAHLITEDAPNRYSLHDLLRAYAAEQTHTHDSHADRHDAVRRACDFYTHTAYAADRLLAPQRSPLTLEPARGVRPLALADDAAAMAWFDAEHTNLLTTQHLAAAHAWHLTVWQLAWSLYTYHSRRGNRDDQLATWEAALRAAENLADPAARALAHRLLGVAHADLGHHDEAIGHLNRAIVLAEHDGDAIGQAHAHRILAAIWQQYSGYREALPHATRAKDLYRTLDQPVFEAHALNLMGWSAAHLGDYHDADAYCETALALHRRHHDLDGEAAVLDSLGYIEHLTGRHEQAIDRFRQALALMRKIAHVYECANTLDNLGHPYAALGQYQHARAAWQEALDLYREQGRTGDADRIQRQLDTLKSPGGSESA